MKKLAFCAIAMCFVTPAFAQDLANAPLVNPDAFNPTSSGGVVVPLRVVCKLSGSNTPAYSLPTGACNSSQLAGGYVNLYDAAGVTTVTQVPSGALVPGSHVGVDVHGYFPDVTAPAGISTFSGTISLSSFRSTLGVASQQELASLQSQVDETNARVSSYIVQSQRQQILAIRGVALAGSLNLASPIAGKSNRLSTGIASFGNQTAMSINYTHQSGSFDFGFAAATAGGDGLGKASMGFSW